MKQTDVYWYNYDATGKIVVNRGGTRSSKTYSICQQLAIWLTSGLFRSNLTLDKGVATVVRRYRANLDGTVIRDFEDVLTRNDLYRLIDHNKTKKTYEYQGRLVEFIGADDEQKLRGAKRNILYCNEANEIEYKRQFFQLLMRTEDVVVLDFNPDDPDVWIKTELEDKRAIEEGDVDIIVSSYKDNNQLPDSLVKEIELLEKNDPIFWKIYGLGEYGRIHGLVFNNWSIGEFNESAPLVGYGLDFGFTNDPTALGEHRLEGNNLYIRQLIYDRGMTNQDIGNRMSDLGIDKRDYICADSAEPKSIEELYRMGFNVHGAKKGKDSVNNSIDVVKRYNVIVCPTSTDYIKEYKTYKWLEDKKGNTLNKPVGFNDHGIAGTRYLAMAKLNTNRSGKYFIR